MCTESIQELVLCFLTQDAQSDVGWLSIHVGPIVTAGSGVWWLIDTFFAFRPKDRGFKSRFSRHVYGTLSKFLAHNVLHYNWSQSPNRESVLLSLACIRKKGDINDQLYCIVLFCIVLCNMNKLLDDMSLHRPISSDFFHNSLRKCSQLAFPSVLGAHCKL